MEKFSYKFAVMLLAFSVGVAFASIFYFQSKVKLLESSEIVVEENYGNESNENNDKR